MKKNVASQVVGWHLASKTDGSEITSGTTTVYVTGDAGTQATGTVGSGAATHEGHGYWTYAPSQAETNYDQVAFTFVNSSAVSGGPTIYPSSPQTGDNYARLGAPAGASVSADIAAIQSDTDNIQTRLPTSLVSGRIDASVGAMASGVLTATAIAADAITAAKVADGTIDAATFASGAINAAAIAADAITAAKIADGAIDAATFAAGAINAAAIAADAITDAKVASDVTIASVTGAVGSVTGNVGGNVTGSVGSVASGGIAASSFAAGAIDASAIATDAIGALELAAGAASEIATAVRTELATELGRVDVAISTRASQTSVDTIDDFVDTEVAAIKAKTDNLPSDPADQSLIIAATDAIVSLIGTPAGASVSADIAAVQADTDNIQTRLPAALVSGRMDASVGAMAANVITATAINADAITDAKVASDVTIASVTGAVGSVTGLTASDVGDIKTVTDRLNGLLENVGGDRFTAQALEEAPTSGGASAADIADAVWDEMIADHLDAGSTGDSLNNATAAGNPWATVIEGSYTAEDLFRIMAGVLAGKTGIVKGSGQTATITFRDVTDSSDILVVTMNKSERTGTTVTP